MESLKGRLTREEARELIESGLIDDSGNVIHRWKKAGYIKKSELEEARARFKEQTPENYPIHDKYEEALKYIKALEIEVGKLYHEIDNT